MLPAKLITWQLLPTVGCQSKRCIVCDCMNLCVSWSIKGMLANFFWASANSHSEYQDIFSSCSYVHMFLSYYSQSLWINVNHVHRLPFIYMHKYIYISYQYIYSRMHVCIYVHANIYINIYYDVYWKSYLWKIGFRCWWKYCLNIFYLHKHHPIPENCIRSSVKRSSLQGTLLNAVICLQPALCLIAAVCKLHLDIYFATRKLQKKYTVPSKVCSTTQLGNLCYLRVWIHEM